MILHHSNFACRSRSTSCGLCSDIMCSRCDLYNCHGCPGYKGSFLNWLCARGGGLFGAGSAVNVSVGAPMQLNLGHIASQVVNTLSQNQDFCSPTIGSPSLMLRPTPRLSSSGTRYCTASRCLWYLLQA